ncbi:hypothetical protein Vau01_110270 [Virgisporangium aurantiacum]|uniref:Uncharacterized protein n=1 Tax=Virgisporangium aurantiacum TaxID=175570 RepID=A0A8J3ZGP1_9ACTN|nr:hypothetical protein Vau01_110270 [Virgisporangium aurantiacum]
MHRSSVREASGGPRRGRANPIISHQDIGPAHTPCAVAGYGGEVEIDVFRAYSSLRSLMEIRWLVEHGYGAPATLPQVAVHNSLAARA